MLEEFWRNHFRHIQKFRGWRKIGGILEEMACRERYRVTINIFARILEAGGKPPLFVLL